jgi:plastocyanin
MSPRPAPILTACVLLAACTGPAGPPDHDAAATPVAIEGFTFTPDRLTVPVGSRVVFHQRDDSVHTVDFEDGIGSGDLANGETFEHTFSEAGTYAYACFFHPSMTGAITVTG